MVTSFLWGLYHGERGREKSPPRERVRGGEKMLRAKVIDGVQVGDTFWLVTDDKRVYVARYHEVLSDGSLQDVVDMLEKVIPAPDEGED